MLIAFNVYAVHSVGNVNAKKERNTPPSGAINVCDERLVSRRQHLKMRENGNNVHQDC